MQRLSSPIIREAVRDAVRGVLYRALSAAGGSVAKAAMTLGTSRTSMHNMLRRYGIKRALNPFTIRRYP